jgi:hypothetical protein
MLAHLWLPWALQWPFPPGVFIAILAFLVSVEAWVNRRREPSRPERAIYTCVALLFVASRGSTCRKEAKRALACFSL